MSKCKEWSEDELIYVPMMRWLLTQADEVTPREIFDVALGDFYNGLISYITLYQLYSLCRPYLEQ